MGKQSTRENKTIYQLCQETAGLTSTETNEKMDFMQFLLISAPA